MLSGVHFPRVLGIGVGIRHRFVRAELVISLLVAMVIGAIIDVVDVVPLSPDEVGQLVKDDVVGEVRREGGEAGVELDAAGAGCAAPERCLATDAQPPGRIAVLPGEGAQASGEDGAGGPPVEPIGREDGLAAAAAGALQTGERPPDPAELGQGEPVGLIE